MSKFKEYHTYDALGLAELVKKNKVSPFELCEEAISRIETYNPEINAVIYKMYDSARDLARSNLPDGPFKGVPFLLKDLLASLAGIPMSMGCRGYKNYIPTRDSELVKRYKAAGVVILGKTNLPEFGIMGITEPELHGPTLNPWNTNHTPGGSSGGSGAAVASTMVPMASGGDGGGSMRIPASCCGLFALKPSRGRNPMGPDMPHAWQGAVVEHVLTRSVRDSAAMLDATHGADPGAPYIIQKPERPYYEETKRDPGKLKIAFSTRSPIDTVVHPENIKAVKDAAKLLESLGHHVEEREPDLDGRSLLINYFLMNCAEIGSNVAELEKYLGRKAGRKDIETVTGMLATLGKAYSASEYAQSLHDWNSVSRSMGDLFSSCDIYMTPATATPPAKTGELLPKPCERIIMELTQALRMGKLLKISGLAEKIALSMVEHYPFTQIANLSGLPAMSVPLRWTGNGLPCGVQFIGDFGKESLLFRLAAQLEKATPWFDKVPEMVK